MSDKPIVDWGPLQRFPQDSIECRCGQHYRSRCKAVRYADKLVLVTETPCPGCGAEFDHVRAARSGPEEWTL